MRSIRARAVLHLSLHLPISFLIVLFFLGAWRLTFDFIFYFLGGFRIYTILIHRPFPQKIDKLCKIEIKFLVHFDRFAALNIAFDNLIGELLNGFVSKIVLGLYHSALRELQNLTKITFFKDILIFLVVKVGSPVQNDKYFLRFDP